MNTFNTVSSAKPTHCNGWASVRDTVVIGAGPAGALAARELALAGLDVLLVERKPFPRWKVCGACLNGRALATLDDCGLGDVVDSLGGLPLREFRLAASGRTAALPLPAGAAVSRSALDAALVQEAVDAGAEFLPETAAKVLSSGTSLSSEHEEARTTGADPWMSPGSQPLGASLRCVPSHPANEGCRAIELICGDVRRLVEARVVVVAAGLNGGLFADSAEFPVETANKSRIGAGVVLDEFPASYQPGVIHMAVADGGYVGLVRVEDGRLNVAAAFSPQSLKRTDGPGSLAAGILRSAGTPVPPSIESTHWQGTVSLTRRTSSPAGDRVFLIGDAAGYVEPFTGEGIAWAFASARAVAPLVKTAATNWSTALTHDWIRTHGKLIGRRQRLCRVTAHVLRRPRLVAGTVRMLNAAPSLARPIVGYLNRSALQGAQ